MNSLRNRIAAFARLGDQLHEAIQQNGFPEKTKCEDPLLKAFARACIQSHEDNPWFTTDNIILAIQHLANMLTREQLQSWTQQYPALLQTKPPKSIAVVMAGNIPLVGFHDFLSVLISGNRFFGKLSSDDQHLLPALSRILIALEPALAPLISFSKDIPHDFDAAIATGSNNSARYFEYHFGSVPHIIRKNRSGIAIIQGHESETALKGLAEDVFSFFGLGCRNVSKIYLPADYPPEKLFPAFKTHERRMLSNPRYLNNYRYNKAIFQMHAQTFCDNGFSLLIPDESLNSAVSVVHYAHYESEKGLSEELSAHSDEIQCIVSDQAWWPDSFAFGMAQQPDLHDYADGVDTMMWLTDL